MTGSEPAAGTQADQTTADPGPVLDTPEQTGREAAPAENGATLRRTRNLTRAEIRELAAMCSVWISRCGLDTAAGRRALALRKVLESLEGTSTDIYERQIEAAMKERPL